MLDNVSAKSLALTFFAKV